MGAIINRFRLWWETTDKTQRLVAVFGLALLVVMLAGVVMLASKPKYVDIFNGLSPKDYSPIVQELNAKGIDVQYDDKGNVKVPENKRAEAMMYLASANKLPTSQGGDSLATMGAFTPKAQQDEALRSAKESKLASSIETIEGVASALVHINPGRDSAFADQKTPATAVVNLTEKSGINLTKDQAKAIGRLVQNAVNGITPEGVVVINSQGQVLYDGSDEAHGTSSSSKIDAQIAESKRKQRELQALLDPVFGAGNTVARVDVDLDMDEVSSQTDSNSPTETPLTADSSKEEMSPGGSTTAGGASGLTANTGPGTPPNGTASGSGKYTSQVTHSNYGENRVRQNTAKAKGALKGMTVNVIANKTGIKDMDAVKKVAEGFLGANMGQDGFSASVTETEFDTSQVADAKKAAASASSGEKMQQMLSILPIVALLIVGVMVAKSLGKGGQSTQVLALEGSGGQPGQTLSLQEALNAHVEHAAGLANAPMQMSSQPTNAEIMQLSGMGGAGAEGDDDDDDVAVSRIRSKVDVPLEQIRQMASRKPEAVATLLKSWMLEERR